MSIKIQDYWNNEPQKKEKVLQKIGHKEHLQGTIPAVLPKTSTLASIFHEEIAGQAVWKSALFTIIVVWDDFGGFLTAEILVLDKVYFHSNETFDLNGIEQFLYRHTPYTKEDRASWVPFRRHEKTTAHICETDMAMEFYKFIEKEQGQGKVSA